MRKRKKDITQYDNLNPTFRHRNIKKSISDNRSTLKLKHKEKMEEFKERSERIEEKEEEIKEKEKKLEILEGTPKKDHDIYTEIYKMTEEIRKGKEEIERIKGEKGEIEYLLTTSELFNEYFKEKSNKKDIYEEYLRRTKDINAEYKKEKMEYIDTKCKLCGGENTFIYDSKEDYISCEECGYSKRSNIQRAVGNLGYKEIQDHDIQNQFAYQRISHFNEQLENIQGMQLISIPEKYIEAIKDQIKKENYPMEKMNERKIKFYLKKLNLNRYYEHSQKIIQIITGKEPPKMEEELIETLRAMFNTIQGPYNKNKPDNRKSFLNYRYVLYKFCELLGRDEYLVYFPLLKSQRKLEEHDRAWRSICEELNWEYHSSCNMRF